MIFIGVHIGQYLLARDNWKNLIQTWSLHLIAAYHTFYIAGQVAGSDFNMVIGISLFGFFSFMGILEAVVFVRGDWNKKK